MADAIRIDGNAVDTIPADDRGLAYGDGIFRTLRLRAGQPIAWPAHCARLEHDRRALGLPAPDYLRLRADIEALADRMDDGVIKILITRGSGGRGYTPPESAAPRCIVSRHPAPPEPPAAIALDVSPVVLATPTPLPGVKHLNRLEQVLARADCAARNAVDVVMCDSSGRVVCTTMRNLVFADRAGRWHSPDLSRAGVIGATRERLRAAVNTLDIRDIALAQLDVFCAAIACNSVSGAIPVMRIGAHRFDDSAALAARANAVLAADI